MVSNMRVWRYMFLSCLIASSGCTSSAPVSAPEDGGAGDGGAKSMVSQTGCGGNGTGDCNFSGEPADTATQLEVVFRSDIPIEAESKEADVGGRSGLSDGGLDCHQQLITDGEGIVDTVEHCCDAFDNDCDGWTDYEDPDCAYHPGCP